MKIELLFIFACLLCNVQSEDLDFLFLRSNPCIGLSTVTFRRYSNKCDLYVKCDGETYLKLYACPYDFYFDEQRQFCDVMENVPCDPTTGTPDPDAGSTELPPTPPPVPLPIDDPRCANSTGVFYVPEPECAEFVECFYGLGFEMQCPEGFYFDEEDVSCKDPSETACGASSTSTTTTTTTTTPSLSTTTTTTPATTTTAPTTTTTPSFSTTTTTTPATTITTTTTTTTMTPTPTTAPTPPPTTDPLCLNLDPDHIVIIPHETNCTLFYECYLGEKTLYACDDGLWFNEIIQSCDFPLHSGCVMCSPDKVEYFPYPEDCTKYYECYEGDHYLLSCPPGEYYSPSQEKCVRPEEAECLV